MDLLVPNEIFEFDTSTKSNEKIFLKIMEILATLVEYKKYNSFVRENGKRFRVHKLYHSMGLGIDQRKYKLGLWSLSLSKIDRMILGVHSQTEVDVVVLSINYHK